MSKKYFWLVLVATGFLFTTFANAGGRTCRNPPGPAEDPGPNGFWASSPKTCPLSEAPIYSETINASVEDETTLDCYPLGFNSISCGAYPQEYVAGGGAPSYLVYEWSVRINLIDYNYPPTFDPYASFGCASGDNVFVMMRVWNGSTSSSRTAGFTCGNEVE